MSERLYEYKGVLWEYINPAVWVVPFCPVHRMELIYDNEWGNAIYGTCEDCDKEYDWDAPISAITDYLRRKLKSEAYKEADIISIDGIQTPQVKTRVKIPEENSDYWVEARVNNSKKGRQLVLYVGEKGSSKKMQLFANLDDEKLSFDHKDRKPEEIFATITATFPSGKKMTIKAPET
ncbi:MAG TPA: hypothetical protein VHB72_03160 [Candidatus Saccharimonadales bacterium]|nr:hypothetical protein [Candidatus Saccharimonadales bacterium]